MSTGGASPFPHKAQRRKNHIKNALGKSRIGNSVSAHGRKKFGNRPINGKKKGGFKAPYKDQQYFSDIGGANYKRQSTLNSLGAEAQAAKIGYGFDTDPTTNPYSRAAMLQSSYNKATRGTTNAMAEQGQLYSGSTSNALASDRAAYGQQYDSARKDYNAELDKIRSGRSDARADYNFSAASAGQDAIARAAKDRPDPYTVGHGKRKQNKHKSGRRK